MLYFRSQGRRQKIFQEREEVTEKNTEN